MSEPMPQWYVTLGDVASDDGAPGPVRSACLHALAALDGYRAQVHAVRALCADRQAETNDGSMTDTQELWPSQVLAALDAAVPGPAGEKPR